MEADRGMDAGRNFVGLEDKEISRYRFMEAIAHEVSKNKEIVLKGGGALLFAYGSKRLSDDLDFDATKSLELENCFEAAAKNVLLEIKSIRIKKNTNTTKRYKIDCLILKLLNHLTLNLL